MDGVFAKMACHSGSGGVVLPKRNCYLLYGIRFSSS